MRLDRRASRSLTRSLDRFEPILRLDLVRNPYGPCPAALEAVEMRVETPGDSLTTAFRRRLSDINRVPIEAIHLLSNANSGLRSIAKDHTGPFVCFPPSAAATLVSDSRPLSTIVSIARGPNREGIIGAEVAADIPEDGIGVIDSPSDPLGSILSPADAVRLSRACRYLVLDERFAEFSEFSLLPLAMELENVMVVRSFEAWAGLQDQSCAWAVASPRLAAALGLEHAVLEPDVIASALATLDSRASVSATLKLVREERSRLYRLLRKLTFLEPLPSWAPFVSARVAMAPREAVVDGLLARGIRVHAPLQSGLEQFVRIGIGSRTTMDRLRLALLEIATELVQ